MSQDDKKEEHEDIGSIRDSTIEEEFQKAKVEVDGIDFMNIVDKGCIVQNEEDSQNRETNVEEYDTDISSPETDYEYSPKQGSIRNKLEMFERRCTNKEVSNTKAELEELNTYVRGVGEEENLLKQAKEESEQSIEQKSEKISKLKPFGKVERKKVVRIDSDILGVKGLPSLFVDNLRIKKYPGLLYINISSIERYMSTDKNVKSVNVRFESGDLVYETPEYDESPTINMNLMIYLGVMNMDNPIKIRFILQKHYLKGERVDKVCESDMLIDKEAIEKIHNNITEFENIWTPYTSNNIVKNFFSFFTNNVADAWCLKTHMAFISEEEIQVIGGPIPSDLYELSRWIKIKKYSYTSWFNGFVNIRGNLQEVCTFLWKRRYVQWCGYIISVYNEQSRSLVGSVNLIDIITKGNESVKTMKKESKIRITSGKSLIEFHFDSIDKFNTFKNVIDAIL